MLSEASTQNLDAESAREHAEAEHHLTPRIYVAIWAALIGLVILTLVLGEVPLGRWNFPIAFLIAMIKAVLIVLFFMHVRYSPGLIRVVAFAGFFWFAIMLGLTFADYFTRDWLEPNRLGPAPAVPASRGLQRQNTPPQATATESAPTL
jgi:cytochrome c oxidase subunit IV